MQKTLRLVVMTFTFAVLAKVPGMAHAPIDIGNVNTRSALKGSWEPSPAQ
ncbi:MAG TPA: hypothetical protein VJX68_10390 [Candidatus Binatus sp.]|nr:hypothetical protein [Candidatus Binatus sp.]HKN13588.1 hypothetical protein [Candidatus Binatus sp.]